MSKVKKERTYNLKYFRENEIEDPEMLPLLSLYQTDTADLLQKIESAYTNRNLPDFKFYIHKIKANIMILGVEKAKNYALFVATGAENLFTDKKLIVDYKTFLSTMKKCLSELKHDFK